MRLPAEQRGLRDPRAHPHARAERHRPQHEPCLDLAISTRAARRRQCVSGSETARDVTADEAAARQANLTGTPSVLVNGVLVSNPTVANISRAIENALQ
ncbi:MAG: thioredoxin domain-containing protein [Trueperaceae bacterium]|nr:thioredoxin domain-containing protein [Trueperaceae bacterium]